MLNKRTSVAIAAALLLGLVTSTAGAGAAMADTVTDTAPPVTEAVVEPTQPAVEPSPDPAPVADPAPAAPTTEAPAADPTPEAVTTSPAVEPVSPATTPEPVEAAAPSAEPESAPVAKVAQVFPPLAPGHTAYARPGWSWCWRDEVNRTNVNLIDPFDMRTYPVYTTPSIGQPGFVPHDFSADEGTDIWTQIYPGNPLYDAFASGASTKGSGFDISAGVCEPVTPEPITTTTSEVLDANGSTISKAVSVGTYRDPGSIDNQYTDAQSGDSVQTRTTFNIQWPVSLPIIDRSGNPTTDYWPTFTKLRYDAPTVNANGSGWVWPTGVATDCNSSGGFMTPGESVTVACLTTAKIPAVQFSDLDCGAPGQCHLFSTLQVALPGELSPDGDTWCADVLPGDICYKAVFGQTVPIYDIAKPREWLPAATSKSFRVHTDETLTVTPEGLVQDAQWPVGNVQDLDTYITDVPAGGTVLPNGDLEFSSAEVGNFDFGFYLEDPATGLRSQDATGAIEVYEDAPIVIPTPGPTTTINVPSQPVVVAAAVPSKLAYTGGGDDLAPLLILGAFMLLLGSAAIATTARRRRLIAK